MNKKERIDLAKWTMGLVLKNGADQVSVSLSNQREIEIEIRDKKLEKLKESTRNSLNLSIYAQNRYSGHSTNDLRKSALETFISEAVSATKYLAKDEHRSLPDPKYYPKTMDQELGILDKSYEKIESADRVQFAKEIEAAANAQSDQIISTTAGYNDTYSESILAHSNGFLGERVSTYFSAGAETTVKDKEGGRPEDWYWGSVRFRKDLPGAEFLGREAAQRALRKLGQKKIASGKFDMVVENRAALRLLGMLQQPLSGRALQQKSSYLDGMLDKKIASELFTIIDNPFLEKGLGSRHYDSEGLAAKKRVIIDNGVLKSYSIDDYYGKKLGMEPTSGSTSNVIFKNGSRSMDEIIKGIAKGIFVTGFIGGNSNSTTGDFSFGIVGMLIENGKLTQALNEMNISGNGKDFWNQIVELGNDPYTYSSMRTPSMHFSDIEFSGL